MVASQLNIGESAPSTLGYLCFLVLGHSKAVVVCLKKCKDVKDATQESTLLVESERKELTEFFSSLKYLVEKLLVAKRSSDADMVDLGVEQKSWNESLAAKDA